MQQDETRISEKGDGPVTGDDAGSERVSFNPSQQAKVQGLIDDAYRKAYAKAQRTRSSSEEVEKMKGEIEVLKEEKKRLALLKSVSKYNVMDAEEIVKLLEGNIRMDDGGNIAVVNDSGSARINEAGHPVSIDEYIAQWLSSRPHHLRNNGAAGAGSSGAGFANSGTGRYSITDPKAWRRMPREDLDRFMREGIDVYGSAGQVYKFRDVKNPFVEARKKRFHTAAR